MITVIIPTHNRLNRLQDCLRSVLAQTFDAYTVIVVNDGSTDGTKEYLDGLNDTKIKIIHLASNTGQSGPRNAGINAAATDIVAFVDDDCVADENWLVNLYDVLQTTGSDIAYGATYYISENYHGYFPEKLTTNSRGRWPGGANIMFRKRVFESTGPFDVVFDGYHNEDTEMAIRAVAKGFVSVSAKKARVFHQSEQWNMQALMTSAKNLSVWPVLKSKYPHHYRAFGGPVKLGCIAEPWDYPKLLFLPVLIPILLIRYLYHGKRDLVIFFAKWPAWIICRRLLLWRESIKHRVFII